MEPDFDVVKASATAFEAVTHGNWWAVAGVVISGLTWALLGPGAAKFPWLATVKSKPLYSFAVPVVLSMLSGVVAAVTSGQVFTTALLVSVVMSVIKTSGAAFMTFLAATNGAEHIQLAKDAGAAKAAQIDTVSKAIDALGADTKP